MKSFYLITGAPGAGKSTIAEELARKGYNAFDLDDFAHWEHKVTKDSAPVDSECTEEFLETHQWICNWGKVESHLASHSVTAPIIFLGITSNMETLLHHFEKFFLLQCNEASIINRLKTRSTSNFGKTDIEQQNILSWFKDFESRMIRLGAIPIKNDGHINPTVDQLLSHIIPESTRGAEPIGTYPR